MNVVNVHQRLLYARPEEVGRLVDSLASPADALWSRHWPRMRFDRPLGVGARGGHGPIRYSVSHYTPGQMVRFRFDPALGFDGWHGFEVLDATSAHCLLEHRLEMRVQGRALLAWAAVFRPLHDACVEDALSQAQAALGNPPQPVPWSPAVRVLRRLLDGPARRRARATAARSTDAA